MGTYPRSEAQTKLAGESVVIWRVAVHRCMVSIRGPSRAYNAPLQIARAASVVSSANMIM